MKIAVYCGSAPGNNPAHRAAAARLGEWIGAQGHTLVYGGGDAGLMGEVASSARRGGADVFGVLPGNIDFICARPQTTCTQVLIEKDMAARKQKMLELADAFIALPGGIGTMDEISEAITLTRIGVFHKPAVFLNADGFYEPFRKMLLRMEQDGFLAPKDMETILFSDDLLEIGRFLER